MNDKTLVERQMVAGDIHAGTYADLNRQIETLQSRIEALEAALRGMVQAVCGETGFAAAVRNDTGLPFPWPALDIAEERAKQALESKP
jgi:N-acetyl-anhydromuramyl-L-alanine amidase AmpD